ncbi:hypothetical protein AAH978_13085 [Streptomyces sp. ZYX-F-203]
MSDSSTLPPARLRPEAELAGEALSAPLLARAARLARWAGPDTRVGAGGELVDELLAAAAEELAPVGENAEFSAGEAWDVAVATGLVEIVDEEEGTVAAGADLALLTAGSPRDVLEVWLTALDAVIADAGAPDLGELVDAVAEAGGGEEIDLSSLDWDPDAEADFLDAILANLYLITVGEDAPEGLAVPLPALAASVLVPDDMPEPSDEVLERVSRAMVRLDEQFRLLEPVGLVAYHPVDEALLADVTDETQAPAEEAEAPVDDSDVTRYGMVRLTPLGLFGLRARLREAGFDAPAVGELADKDAAALLDGTARFPSGAAQAETERWLADREPRGAAGEMLAAARGADPAAPLRRLRCQQALSLVGADAEPALREVLDDPELGGLARVWLTERDAADVPPPSQDMVFWLTVDTLAAQLAAEGESEELRALVEGLAGRHSGFFETVWRVDHPATADVLETVGRLHPDKRIAKDARKAAFRARSRRGD